MSKEEDDGFVLEGDAERTQQRASTFIDTKPDQTMSASQVYAASSSYLIDNR